MLSLLVSLKNKISTLYRKVSNNSKILQTIITLALIGIHFYPTYKLQRSLNKDIAYAIARGAGATLKQLLFYIFVPTLRMIHAKAYPHLRKLPDPLFIGRLFHNRMSLHKILGSAILASGAVHIIAHAARRSVAWFSQESLTGMMMMTLIAVPIASMYLIRSCRSFLTKALSKMSYYIQFLIPHQLGWWGLISILGAHTRDQRLLSWSIGILGLFSFDRIWEWAKSHNVAIKKIKKIHEKMIILEIEKPRGYKYQAGEKAYLSYPPDHAFVNHLHPFTIASSPDENILRFVISDLGEWSHELINSLQVGDVVRIGPSFPSSLDSALAKDTHSDRLFITSGSGLAVTLAHLHDYKDSSPISIIHCSRYREEFALLNEHVNDKRLNFKAAHYYDTSKTYKSKLRSGNEPMKASTSEGRFISQNNAMLNQFKGRVYFCGNDDLGDELEKSIADVSSQTLFREKFNF